MPGTFRNAVSIAFVVAAFLGGSAPETFADELRMGGTGSVPVLLERLGAICTKEPGTKVVVTRGLGTAGGLQALSERALDIAVSGRPLTPEDTATGLTRVASVRTPYVLITSHASPNGLKGADVTEVYGAIKPTWADGTPIRVILRPKSSAEVVAFQKLFPGMGAALEKAYQRRDIPIAATDQDNVDLAESVPGSLTAASYVQLKTESRNVRFVPLDGVEPTLESFERGEYSYGRTLHFVVSASPSPAAERFIACMRSPPGIQTLREAGALLIPG